MAERPKLRRHRFGCRVRRFPASDVNMEIVDMVAAGTMPITPERLMQFTFGFAPPLIIEAAIRHSVFNVLDQGAKSLEAVCAETNTSPRGLRAILNALVGLELLAKDDQDRYALTPESARFLVSGKPTFMERFSC
jgi:hypothetical protein